MAESAQVIIIGGGIVGMSAAYHLAKAGANPLLIDRHHTGRATDAGAGILAPRTSGTTVAPAWFEYADVCMELLFRVDCKPVQ